MVDVTGFSVNRVRVGPSEPLEVTLITGHGCGFDIVGDIDYRIMGKYENGDWQCLSRHKIPLTCSPLDPIANTGEVPWPEAIYLGTQGRWTLALADCFYCSLPGCPSPSLSEIRYPLTVYVQNPPPPGYGYLDVASSPAGASVYLDNTFIGNTPVVGYVAGAGPHTLKIVLTGYQPITQSITIPNQDTLTLSFALEEVGGVDQIMKFITDNWPYIAIAGGALVVGVMIIGTSRRQ